LVQRRLTPQDSSAKPGDEYRRIVLSGGDQSQLGVRSFVPGLVGLDLDAVVLEEQLVDSGLRGVVADQVGCCDDRLLVWRQCSWHGPHNAYGIPVVGGV
jgi:hypothetical protein